MKNLYAYGLLLAVLVFAYFYLFKQKSNIDNTDNDNENNNNDNKNNNLNSYFPLHYGSKGVFVRRLQQALQKRFGNNVLPKYGADGVWGDETQTVLTRYKLLTKYSMQQWKDVIRGLLGAAKN